MSEAVIEGKEAPAAPVRQQIITGEVHVKIDPDNGAINISAPENLIVALGILETAKAILIKRQQDLVAKAQEAMLSPKIVRPGVDDLAKVARPS